MLTQKASAEIRLDISEDVARLALMLDDEIKSGTAAPDLMRLLELNNRRIRPKRRLTAVQIHNLLAQIGLAYLRAVVSARDQRLKDEPNDSGRSGTVDQVRE